MNDSPDLPDDLVAAMETANLAISQSNAMRLAATMREASVHATLSMRDALQVAAIPMAA